MTRPSRCMPTPDGNVSVHRFLSFAYLPRRLFWVGPLFLPCHESTVSATGDKTTPGARVASESLLDRAGTSSFAPSFHFRRGQMFTAYDMLEQARDTYKRVLEKVGVRHARCTIFTTPWLPAASQSRRTLQCCTKDPCRGAPVASWRVLGSVS